MGNGLLNKKGTKQFILLKAESMRSHKFERVSGEFIEALELALMNMIENWITSHPSKGKTLYSPTRSSECRD